MKKIILAIIFVFATGIMLNAKSSNDKLLTLNTESTEIIEEFGCASDCVRWARDITFVIAEDIGDHLTMMICIWKFT